LSISSGRKRERGDRRRAKEARRAVSLLYARSKPPAIPPFPSREVSMAFGWSFGGPFLIDYYAARVLMRRAGKRRVRWGLIPLAVGRYGSQLLGRVRVRQREEEVE